MPELIDVEPGTPEWLAARKQGVTATDIVTILGLSSYDSPYSLFWRKLGQVPDVEDNDRFRLGRFLESYVADRWAEVTGKIPLYGALYRHSIRSWQLATLDRHIDYEPVELKSWADADRSSWGIEGGTEVPPSGSAATGAVAGDRSSEIAGSPKDGARPGPIAPRIPPAVRAQVLWQMDVLDVATGHVGVVFLPSGRFESYTIEHKHEPWAAGTTEPTDRIICPYVQGSCYACLDLDVMRVAGEEFWRRLTLELPPPDPDSSAATLAAVRARFARADAKQAEVEGKLFADWLEAKGLADEWIEQARAYEIQIREQAGEASELCVDGELVARRVIVDAQVKAHTRHQDYLKRIKPKEDDGAVS